jgi:hypothetical protein
MDNGHGTMGNGQWVKGKLNKLCFSNYQCPMPNSQCPVSSEKILKDDAKQYPYLLWLYNDKSVGSGLKTNAKIANILTTSVHTNVAFVRYYIFQSLHSLRLCKRFPAT